MVMLRVVIWNACLRDTYARHWRHVIGEAHVLKILRGVPPADTRCKGPNQQPCAIRGRAGSVNTCLIQHA